MRTYLTLLIFVFINSVAINAQVSFTPLFSSISDIQSNNEMIMMCNGGCQALIASYDRNGNVLWVERGKDQRSFSFQRIKTSVNGEFLVGGRYVLTDDVVNSPRGSLLYKYNTKTEKEFEIEKKWPTANLEGKKTVFSFISDNRIALGIGDNKMIVLDDNGRIIDSVMFEADIQDIGFLNPNNYVVLDIDNQLMVLDSNHQIIKKQILNLNYNYYRNIINVDEQSIIVYTDKEVVLIKDINSTTPTINKIIKNKVINDVYVKDRKVIILVDNYQILTISLNDLVINTTPITELLNNRNNNVFSFLDEVYYCETYNKYRVAISYFHTEASRKEIDVSIEGFDFAEIIYDSIYVEPSKKYWPVTNAKINVLVQNNSADTIKSYKLIGNFSRGINCSGVSELYDIYQVIPPFEERNIEQIISIKRAFDPYVRNIVCFSILHPNEWVNDNQEWVCEPYTSVKNIAKDELFNIYPNPAEDQIFIVSKINQPNSIKIEMINQLGVVYSGRLKDGKLNIHFLPSGIYYIKMDHQYLGKFIKI